MLLFIYLSILSACLYMHHVCAWCPVRSEGGVGSPQTGVTDGWPPCGCWELSTDPLQVQVLLSTEPILQPQVIYIYYTVC